MHRNLVAAVVLLAACTSASRPSDVAKPAASVAALGTPFFGSATDEAPVDLEVTIANRSTRTLRVRSIRVVSMGMNEYTIRSINQRFHDDIAAGETKALIVPATAISSAPGLHPSEPLLLRLDIAFEVNGKIFREVYSGQRIVF